MNLVELSDVPCPQCGNDIVLLYAVTTASGNPPTYNCIECEGRYAFDKGQLQYFKKADQGFKNRNPSIPWKN